VANASILPVLWPAIYGAINVTAVTTTLGYAVYDHVPQTVPSKYVRMQSPTAEPLRAMGNLGGNATIQLHVFTAGDTYHGAGSTQAVVSKLVELLEGASLSLSGFTMHGVLYENEFDAGDEDVNGITYKHYVVAFRVYARAA
jgi:hypothetical protein